MGDSVTYEQLAKRFYAAIKIAAIACIAVRLMACTDSRDQAHRLETESGFRWRECKTLSNSKGEVGTACISTDGLSLALCDDDGCLVFQPTATLERPQ